MSSPAADRPRHGPVPGPVDPDVTPADVRGGFVTGHADVLGVIALGGAVGSTARWLVAEALPHDAGQVPWATVLVNVVGSFLLGMLMVWVVEAWSTRRYVRPFLGVGVLGGFTTFSTFALDLRQLLADGHAGVALAYVGATLVAGLLAVVAGALLGRVLLGTRREGVGG